MSRSVIQEQIYFAHYGRAEAVVLAMTHDQIFFLSFSPTLGLNIVFETHKIYVFLYSNCYRKITFSYL